jgi:hypothetical protein
MPSCGVGSNQHKMIDFSRCVSKPDRDMHGTGPVCGHETVSGPAGGGDLGSGRLVTKVGGCGGSHTDRIVLEQRVDQHFQPTESSESTRHPLKGRPASPGVPGSTEPKPP